MEKNCKLLIFKKINLVFFILILIKKTEIINLIKKQEKMANLLKTVILNAQFSNWKKLKIPFLF